MRFIIRITLENNNKVCSLGSLRNCNQALSAFIKWFSAKIKLENPLKELIEKNNNITQRNN